VLGLLVQLIENCCFTDFINIAIELFQMFRHRWARHQIFLSPISDIDNALSDIGKKFVGLKAFSPISDQSDNETASSDIRQSAIRHQKFWNSTPLHTSINKRKGVGTSVDVLHQYDSFHQKCSKLGTFTTHGNNFYLR
jgi:hypothetical protein